MSDLLGALLRSLQLAGVPMDADLAMDSLWLALRMQERGGAREIAPPGPTSESTTTPGEPQIASTLPTASTPPPPTAAPIGAAATSTPAFALADDEVDTLDREAGRWLTLERTAALSMGLELSRALRPLRRRVKVPGRGRLDVEATVRRVIDEFVFLPSFLPARERWLDVLLVLDHGLSMIVWKETLDAFERVLRSSGAFRNVRSFWLETDEASPTLRSRAGGARTRSALQLPAAAHARSRTVVLTVSDCVGGRWHDGTVPELLSAWGKALPVSLLQVTPDWYWPRTALGEAAQGPVFAASALTRNARLTWSTASMGLDGLLPDEAGPFAPVPLAAMTPRDIGRLARLLAGAGEGSMNGALFDLSWRDEGEVAGPVSATSRVARFHALATSDARRLAAAFASSPVQTLGMLRLLRRDLLPGSAPFVEAELLLGGIVRIRAEDASWDAGAALRLEFMEGVRELLQDSATAPDVLRVLRHASRAAEGGGGETFSAWLSEPELREAGLGELGEAFVGAVAPVLRRLGGAYAWGVRGVGAARARDGEVAVGSGVATDDRALISAEDPAGSAAANAFVGTTADAEDTGKATSKSFGGGVAEEAEGPEKAQEKSLGGAAGVREEERARWSHEAEAAPTLVGREREMRWLRTMTTNREMRARIGWVYGDEGIGKSALLAELLRERRADSTLNELFYWSFAKDLSVDHCLRAMIEFHSRGGAGTDVDTGPSELQAALLEALAHSQPNVIVLDDVDRLASTEKGPLLETISLISGNAAVATHVVLAAREAPAREAPAKELALAARMHLEPLHREAIESLIQASVTNERFAREVTEDLREDVLEDALASGDLLAALSGGNPELLLSLLDGIAIGITPEALRAQFTDKDGSLSPLSVARYRQSNPRIFGMREVRGLLERAESSAASGRLSEALADARRASEMALGFAAQDRVGGELTARALQVHGMINLQMGNREEGTAQLRHAFRTAHESGATALAETIRDVLDERAPSFDDPVVQAVFHVYGRVSGVGFRAWVERQARELQLEGTAENLPDGRIRVTASGQQSRVDQLEQRLRVGPPLSAVSRVTREGTNVASAGADVFLSYASVDREVAVRLGELLEGEGLSVFVDQASLQGGEGWREALDAALDRARCVVMLLSRASVASDWVLRESRRGLQRKVLVPVKLEHSVPLPLELKEMHVGDLSGWDRSGGALAFRELLSAVVGVVGGEPPREGNGRSGDEVAPEVASVSVTAVASSLTTGTRTQATVVARDAQKRVLSLRGRTVVWSSAAAGVATVSPAGLITAAAPGNTTIGVTVDGVGPATFVVTVSPASNASARVSASDSSDDPSDIVESKETSRLADEPAQSQGTDVSSTATSALDLAALDLADVDGEGWVQLAAGSFRMGSREGESREQPSHVVSCSAMRISRFPVTNRQYEQFLTTTGGTPPPHWEGGLHPRGTEHHPVTNVSWQDAVAFCTWLTGQVASHAGGVVQLPTEAQWEFAARGVEGRRYPWGDAAPTAERANFGGQRGGFTPVNAYPAGATPSGIWDMAGNAWEWCRDWYGGYASEPVQDPPGPSQGSMRTIRGGSYQSEAEKLRGAYRANRWPDGSFDRGGFRVVWGAEVNGAASPG